MKENEDIKQSVEDTDNCISDCDGDYIDEHVCSMHADYAGYCQLCGSVVFDSYAD